MKNLVILCSLFISFSSFSQDRVTFDKKTDKVDVLVGGKYFTSYYFPGESILKKAVLFPILSAQGSTITRGYPMAPRAGERVDHPHHVGMWLNYEDVNGYDYWNNSTNIISSLQSHKMGTIKHEKIVSTKPGKSGELVVTAAWVDDDGTGKRVLDETTTYVFSGSKDIRVIDRITTLTAVSDMVTFKDVKDGMFAIRVARQLEIPSNKPDVFTDAHGVETKVPVMDNTGVSGNYVSSEGIQGEAVWSTRAKWMNLTGELDKHTVNVAILDHPANVSYPSYWHARGYGLFAVNPLGVKVFSNGKSELNYSLKKGEKLTFRYRTLIADRSLSKVELDEAQAKFAQEVK
ncbi:PmoA family protein [Aquirufa sp. OSTEICH-129V]|uniref:PmoA family protein n=1 Tax=Aquirufa avitistagni TaxID=3104728 RepID=A0ABW6DCL2_9BACT